MQQAALDAGYSQSTSRVACRAIMPQTREAFREALHRRISIGKLSDTISAGLEANETKLFQKDGVVTDERDLIAWSERREYAKLAANLMSFEPPKEITGADGGPILIGERLTIIREQLATLDDDD